MTENPRNQGTSTVDAILLYGMTGVFVVLGGVIWYLAEMTTAAINAGQ